MGLESLLSRGLKTNPDRVCAEGSNESVTFQQLNALAESIAAWLVREVNVEPQDRVVVFAERKIEMLALALGIWRAKAIYVPIFSETPLGRVQQMFELLEPAVVVGTSRNHALSADKADAAFVNFESFPDFFRESKVAVLALGLEPAEPEDTAIILHTSGSTGVPKGVELSHENVLCYFDAQNRDVGFNPNSVSINNGPFEHDISLLDTFMPIYFGAKVVFHLGLFAPSVIFEILQRKKITHFICVASILSILSQRKAQLEKLRDTSLQVVLFGGEVCPPKTVNAWINRLPNTRFFNCYGPTESSCGCLSYEIEKDPHRNAPYPIGTPFENVKVCLLDEAGEVLDRRQTQGILAISGPQIMKGYWRQPAETARQTFYHEGDRYYITGDVCSVDENGIFRYLGRTDDQIKVLGRRFHLSDIRNNVVSIPHVRHAIVETAVIERKSTVCCLVVLTEKSADIERDVSVSLRQRLPSYMIPQIVVFTEQLPKTSTLKIDESALERILHEGVAEHNDTFAKKR